MGPCALHDPFSTHPLPFNPLPQEHWFVGLAWAWDITFRNSFKKNHKKQQYRRRDLNPHALAGNGF